MTFRPKIGYSQKLDLGIKTCSVNAAIL